MTVNRHEHTSWQVDSHFVLDLVRFVLLPGQAHDLKGVEPLIEGVCFGALLGDKAFDANWLLAELDERGAMAVIPQKANRKIKEFRGIATRYDKTDTSYAANLNLVAAIISAR